MHSIYRAQQKRHWQQALGAVSGGAIVPTRTRVWAVHAADVCAMFVVALIALLVFDAVRQPSWWGLMWVQSLLDPGDYRLVLVFMALFVAGCVSYALSHRARTTGLVLTTATAGMAFVLGAFSYSHCGSDQVPVLTQVWWTMTLFVGSEPDVFTGADTCPAVAPLAAQLGRFLALGATFASLLSLVALFWQRRISSWLAHKAKKKIIVHGVDHTTVHMLRALTATRAEATRVVVVCAPTDGEVIAAAKAEQAIVMATDRSPREVLAQLVDKGKPRGAVDVHLLGPDATSNLQMVKDLEQLDPSANKPGTHIPRLIVRIDDPWAADAWRRAHIGENSVWLTDAISVFEETAIELLDHPETQNATTIVIVHKSPLALALLNELGQRQREAYMMSLDEDGVPVGYVAGPKVLLVGESMQPLLDDFVLAQQRFGNPVNLDVEVVSCSEDSVCVIAASRTSTPEQTPVIFSGPPDHRWPSLGPRVAAQSNDQPVFSWASQDGGIAAQAVMNHYYPFGVGLGGMTGAPPRDNWTRIAQLSHEKYLTLVEEVKKASQRPWDDLPSFYRDSNVRQIRELMDGVDALGRTWTAGSQSDAWQTDVWWDNEIDYLARAEHASWVAFYKAHGWAFKKGEPNEVKQTHDGICAFEDLTPKLQQITIRGIKDNLSFLASLGYRSAVQQRTYNRSGTVTAERLEKQWHWATDTGSPMKGEIGDWKVTDADGDSNSVKPDVFAESYALVEGDTYRRTGQIQARPATAEEYLETTEGPDTATETHWLAIRSADDHWFIPGHKFERNLEPDLSGLSSQTSPTLRWWQRA